MADVQVRIEFDADTGEIRRIFQGVEQQAEKAGRNAGQNLTTSLGFGLKRVRTIAASAAAAIGTAFAAREILNATKAIESIETRFQVLLGSAEAAAKQVEDLTRFAAQTPFQLEGISDAAAQLLSFGFESDTIVDRLRVLGDVAAGSNSELREVALIFGQVSAAGKLTGERLLQLQERAIPIGPALAKALGVAESQVRELVSAGEVGFPIFEQAFRSLTEQGNLFAGATEKQSKTINGLLSTLSDNFNLLNVAIGKALGPAFKAIVGEAITVVQGLTRSTQEATPAILASFQSVVSGLLVFGPPLAQFARDAFQPFIIIGQAVVSTFQVIVSGLRQLLGALGAAAQIAGVEGEFVQGLKAIDDQGRGTTAAIQGLKNTINNAFSPVDTTGFEETLLAVEESIVEARARIAQGGPLIPGLRDPASEDGEDGPADQAVAKFESISDKFSNLGAQFNEVGKQIGKTSNEVGKAIISGIGNGAGSAFAAFGQSLANGQNALKAFAQAFLGVIGQTAVQLGTSFILQGIALSLNPLTPGSGGPLIAAGAALATFGGALSALAGGGGGPAGGGVGVARSGAGSFGEPGTPLGEPVATEEFERQDPTAQVQVNIQGDVLDSQESGLRIVSLLNEAFDRDGAVITNGRFA